MLVPFLILSGWILTGLALAFYFRRTRDYVEAPGNEGIIILPIIMMWPLAFLLFRSMPKTRSFQFRNVRR